MKKKTLLLGIFIFSSSMLLVSFTHPAIASPEPVILASSSQWLAQTSSTYRVKLGDTLSGIADKFGLSVAKLLEYNPSLQASPHLLRVGQVINLSSNPSGNGTPTTSVSSRPQKNTFDSFNISNQRRTGSSRTGARRGSGPICFKNTEDQLRVLLPDDTVMGYTLRDYPTFFWYLPELTAESIPVRFTLRPVEQQGREEKFGSIVYETTFNNYRPGIESFTLPAQAPALKEGQEYEWEVQVKCTDTNFSFIRGRIKRMLTDNAVLAAKLEQASIEDYPSILAEAGVWYDSLATVSELRRANPKESFWTEDWKEILKRIGFEELIAVPERQLNPAQDL